MGNDANVSKRDGFRSRGGFIIACIGSAVGMGNIWRFPTLVSKWGGMTFLLPYFLFVILIGSTGVIGEFALGRAAGAGPVDAFGMCTEARWGKRRPGELVGYIPVLGSLALAIGYTCVMGWIFKYTFLAFDGGLSAMGQDMDGIVATFNATASAWGANVWVVVAVAVSFVIMSFGIAGALEMGSISVVSVILEPIIEIVISLVLGALSGLALNWLETYFHSRSKRLSLTVAFVLLMVGISSMEFELGGVKIGFSLLLVCMMTGTVFCNVCSASEELMSRLDRWTGPINILFFVLSGAELDLNILSNPLVLLIGIIYIVFRSLGKISGSYISCAMTKCSDHIKKHLGITLLPQAGVALGMALTATSLADGSIVRNVVLFSVLVYELIGPSLTKRSLLAAGEIKPEGKTSAREENKPVKPITLK